MWKLLEKCNNITELILLPTKENMLGEIVVNPLPSLVKCINIIHPHAKDKKILLSGLLGHFNIGSVHGTDG